MEVWLIVTKDTQSKCGMIADGYFSTQIICLCSQKQKI